MNNVRGFLLPVALGLFLAPVAFAGDDTKPGEKKELEQTIKGVISEVTLMGETDVDFTTGKAIEADQIFLTIIGHPCNNEAMDKDVKKTSTDDSKSAAKPHHRMNVYVIAVSSKTKFCECKETVKEGTKTVKDEKCTIDKLEIGDCVEVSFAVKTLEKDDVKAANKKHGRHRTYFGVADDVKILEDTMEATPVASKDKK